MTGFDLQAARLARLQQEFDALLPQDDLNLRQKMTDWVADGARQGVDLIPSFREALWKVRGRFSSCLTGWAWQCPLGQRT